MTPAINFPYSLIMLSKALSLLPPNWPALLFKTCLFLFLAYLSFKIVKRIHYNLRWRRRAAALGCLPIPHVQNYDPIFGFDMLYAVYKGIRTRKLLEIDHQRFKTLKTNTHSFSIMGKYFITTMEPQNIKHILATGFADYPIDEGREKVLGEILGQGIFTTNGAAWKHSRELLRPCFERAQIDDSSLFEKHAARLVAAIPNNGEFFDLQPLFFAASLDISSEHFFGQSTDCLLPRQKNGGNKSDVDRFVDAFDQMAKGIIGADSKWCILGMFLPDFEQKKRIKTVQGFVEGIVAKAIEDRKAFSSIEKGDHGGKPRHVFLQDLLNETQDVTKIRSELLNILIAGRESTANLLSNIFFILSQNPAIFQKLEQEILTSLPADKIPTFADLKSLPYLRAMINETQRLYPVVPENNRAAGRDTTMPLGGGPDGTSPVFVPKGTMVSWSLWGMHRRRDFYGEDADEFKPERWLDDPAEGKKGLRVGWEYLPFNGGPRVCIGQQFALGEISYLIVKLVRAFEAIEPEEKGRVWKEHFFLTCTIDDGVRIKMRPRRTRKEEATV